MINLLPLEQKEELREEEKLKLILILGIVILAFLISLILILFSIKTNIFSWVQIQKILLEQREKELKSPQIQELEKRIRDYNLTLSKLDSFYKKNLNLTEILEKTSKTLPAGTYLTNLNFNPTTWQVSLSGFCPVREILLKFKKNLEKEEKFEKVYFPPINWVEPTDIIFSVNFFIKK